MAKRKVLWWMAIVLSTVSLAAAEKEDSAEEDGVEVGVTADVFSKYMWRGQNIIDDWVLQPGASVGYKGLTASIWGNLDLAGDLVDEGELTEVDYTLDYTNTIPGLDILSYSVGTIYYSFFNLDWPDTTELYAGLGLDVPFAPAVRWFYDVDEVDGSYVQFSVGHTIEKLWSWRDDSYCGLQLGASVGYGTSGYNNGYFGVDEGALNDLTLSAGLPFCVGKLTIRPSLGYSTMLDDDVRAGTDESDNFWGGIGFAYDF